VAGVSPGDLAKAASDRFSVVSALPAALVVLMVFALIQTGGFPHRPHPSRLLPAHGQLGAGTVLFLALAVFILALTLQPFQLALVRILEGYWGSSPIGRVLSQGAVKPRQRRLAAQIRTSVDLRRLEPPELTGLNVDRQIEALRQYRRDARAKARADQVRLRSPRDLDRVMPTRLGNALRSFEDTAGQRYGLETVPVFRRLYPLLSTPLVKAYGGYRLQLDTAAGLCVAFSLMTGVSGAALVGDGWWTLVPVAALVLAWLTYRGAITSALLMGGTVFTAFDLHRHDLIAALHYPLAPDPALEFAFNLRLSDWLRDDDPDAAPAPIGMPDSYDYRHAASANVAPDLPVPPESSSPPDAQPAGEGA
jgi:hypothetical protein